MRRLQWVPIFAGLLAVLPPRQDAVAATAADTVIPNGRIHTVDPGHPWAQAMAIAGDRYGYVGTSQGAAAHVGSATRVVDMYGRFAMPGIVHGHVHPIMGGLKTQYECNLPFAATPQQIAVQVGECAAHARTGGWIRCGQWNSGARALRLKTSTGSIETGKSAELIVLDRDLFRIPIREVGAARVELTFFEGRLVYGGED